MKETSTLFKSGDAFLPPIITNFLYRYILGSDKTLLYVNYWSIVHMISGMIVASLLVRFTHFTNKWTLYGIGFVIHSLWECWQIYIGMTNTKRLRDVLDIGTDTVFFLMGMFIVIQIGK
jgi:hypothetical protein